MLFSRYARLLSFDITFTNGHTEELTKLEIFSHIRIYHGFGTGSFTFYYPNTGKTYGFQCGNNVALLV